jgi:hypothetical protein
MRKIAIAQMLLAGIGPVKYVGEDEEGYYYNANGISVRVRRGGSVAVKKGDEWETLEVGVPQDIVDLQDVSMNDFHTSLTGWMADSRAFEEQA